MTEFDRRAQELAQLLLPKGQSRGQPTYLLQGVIEDVYLGRVNVFLEGNTTFPVSGVRYLRGYTPHTGDVVWLFRAGLDTWVIGVLEQKANQVPIEPWHLIGVAGEPAFQNAWINHGSNFAAMGYAMQNDGWVNLKGTAKDGTDNTTMFTLPEGYRPPWTMRFAGLATNVSCEIEINSNGNVRKVQGGTNAEVHIDGLIFPTLAFFEKTKGDTDLWTGTRFEGGWGITTSLNDFPHIYRRPDGWNWMYLVTDGGTTPGNLAIIPEDSRVDIGKYSIMLPGFALGVTRLDVRNSGFFIHQTGGNGLNVLGGTNWWSYRGRNYQKWVDVEFINGWTNYTPDEQWHDVQYMRDSFGVVHLRGLAYGAAKTTNTMFQLPAGFRPAEQQVFLSVRHSAGGGTDGSFAVTPSGFCVGNSATAEWYYVNGRFKAEV